MSFVTLFKYYFYLKDNVNFSLNQLFICYESSVYLYHMLEKINQYILKVYGKKYPALKLMSPKLIENPKSAHTQHLLHFTVDAEKFLFFSDRYDENYTKVFSSDEHIIYKIMLDIRRFFSVKLVGYSINWINKINSDGIKKYLNDDKLFETGLLDKYKHRIGDYDTIINDIRIHYTTNIINTTSPPVTLILDMNSSVFSYYSDSISDAVVSIMDNNDPFWVINVDYN